MTNEQFRSLSTGDLVRSKGGAQAYVVMDNFGDRVSAVRTVDLTNPDEWELAGKASYGQTKRPPARVKVIREGQ